MNNEHKYHKISLSDFDFERTSYISETNFEEDIDESDLRPKNVNDFNYGRQTDLAISRGYRVG